MERYLKRKTSTTESCSTPSTPCQIDLNDLPWDPADRKKIWEYHPNQRDEIRRKYLIRGPCQPRGHSFPKKFVGSKGRRFCPNWFDQYPDWLEYSVKTDKAFCLCCYLFRDYNEGQCGSETFVTNGFDSWNKTERFGLHVGDVNSFHNRALKKSEDLMRQDRSIAVAFHKQSEMEKNEHRIRLNASVKACRFLLKNALPFRGHDESEMSISKGRVQEAIGKCEIETGRGLYQELSLIRAGDTRWGSHYKTMVSLIALFPNVIEVLEYVEEDGDNGFSRTQATGILAYLKTFDFVIYLHLMFHILEVTDLLSQALQKKDQDIVEAISLIKGTKQLLQTFRETGFDPLLKKMYSFCEVNGIEPLNMEEGYKKNGRLRTNITNRHHYEFEIFNTVLDMQLQEFGDRFSEVSTELLKNIAALSPCDSFSQFNVSDLLALAKLYPSDFDRMEIIALEKELNMYYVIVRQDERFANLSGIAELARLMVDTKKHKTYPLVYRLLKLALVLPVATATVERCFSAMKIVKSDLRNKIGDEFLNAALICTIEKDALLNVTNDDVISQFQKMKSRRTQL